MTAVAGPERRGRRAGQRAHPVRHLQHRRARDHQGRGGMRATRSPRSSRRSATRPSTSSPARRAAATSSPAAGQPTPPAARCSIHGHLDVVPAEPADWWVHPFSGAVAGRLRVGPRRGRHEGHGRDDARGRPRTSSATGSLPPRDLVFAFVADEEAGGAYGAQWLVENRPDLFEGVTEAVGEVGGFSLTVPRRDGGERRLYLIQTAEKGIAWMRLTAHAAGRTRLVPARRQRRHQAGRGRGAAGRPPVPAGAHRHRRAVPRPRSARRPASSSTRSPDLEGTIAKLGGHRADRRRHPARHRQPDHAQGRLQGQRHPGDRRGGRRLPGAARAGRRRSSARSTS